MEYTEEFISEILIAINDFESLSQQLLDKVLIETSQKDKDEVLNGNLDYLENTETGELKNNWNFEIHGEHCDFKSKTTGQSLTICLGINSINFLDPNFFYNFLKTTSKHKKLANQLTDKFSSVYSLFQQMENKGILKKVEGFGPAFVKTKNSL